jgi:hypothetical protein
MTKSRKAAKVAIVPPPLLEINLIAVQYVWMCKENVFGVLVLLIGISMYDVCRPPTAVLSKTLRTNVKFYDEHSTIHAIGG